MFEKNLQDLVKGIRSHRRDAGDFISQAIAEIKTELKSVDPFVKAEAVRKLTYLQMMGYDMSWAAFSVIEVMTSSRFSHKRIGYLAANQSFTEETEVILLTTNHLKKEFSSTNQFDAGLAINCLANIATSDLSRDLLGDAVNLLMHPRPYVRKKALLVMYKLFVKYPQGLRLCFDKIKERLDDSDNGVVSCAVNIICELADKNPKNYLALAPRFFKLLTTSSNNWMLIKVVKLLGSLVPEEPRLARKLLEPLATIIQNTAAKSLLYECIHTVTVALPFTRKEDGTESRAVPVVVRLCSDHLKQFVKDPDQNLKYLGLVGFVNLMVSHPKAVTESRELAVGCLKDSDVTIRTRALELLVGMVTKKNIEDLVIHLLNHVKIAEGSYRDTLILRILEMCSKDKYSLLSDFNWYTSVLVELCKIDYGSKLTQPSISVASQLMNISVRVEAVRPFVVESMVHLLISWGKRMNSNVNLAQILSSAAWIIGEYAGYIWDIKNMQESSSLATRIVSIFLNADISILLAETVQSIFILNAFKIYICANQRIDERNRDDDELGCIISVMDSCLTAFEESELVEIQERACLIRSILTSFGIFKSDENGIGIEQSLTVAIKKTSLQRKMDQHIDLLGTGTDNVLADNIDSCNYHPADPSSVFASRHASSELSSLTAEIMKPINSKAQSKVPPPDDVNIEKPLNSSLWKTFLKEDFGNSKYDLGTFSFTKIAVHFDEPEPEYDSYLDAPPSEEIVDQKKDYSPTSDKGINEKKAHSNDPFYLGHKNSKNINPADVDVSHIPIARLTADDFDNINLSKHKHKSKRHTSKKKNQSAEQEEIAALPVVVAVSSDEESNLKKNDRFALGRKKFSKLKSSEKMDGLSAIDITTPLRQDEKIPEQKHHQVQDTTQDTERKLKPDASKNREKKGKTKQSMKRKSKEDQVTDDLLDLINFSTVETSANRTETQNELNDVFIAVPLESVISDENKMKEKRSHRERQKEKKSTRKKAESKKRDKLAVADEYQIL